MTVSIVPLAEVHVPEVARLHCQTLTGLLTRLGLPAARAFYSGAIRSGAATAFVALENDGSRGVRGHVLGSLHPDRLQSDVLRANRLGVMAGVCLGVAARPSSLRWLLRRRKGPDEGSYDSTRPELTYLAVHPESRGAGVGRQLVAAFGRALLAAGAESYELSVDEDNRRAIAFYEGLGFRGIGWYREFGIRHLRYRLPLSTDDSKP